ncbi:MAG TPA: hypothetical protein VLG92_05725 [Candidatus Saccharimonadia bacterium]|nr:hypothetical protein [Candidatus Saccharimonadia bacterium]
MDVYVLKQNWKGEPTEARPGGIDAIAVWQSLRPSGLNVYEMAVRRNGDARFYTVNAKLTKIGPSSSKGTIGSSSLHVGMNFELTSTWIMADTGRFLRNPGVTADDITIVHMPDWEDEEVWERPDGACLVQARNHGFGTSDFFLGGRLLTVSGTPYTGPRTNVLVYRAFDDGHSFLLCGEKRWPTNWSAWVDGKPSNRITNKCRVVFTGPTSLTVTVIED